jgi:predicted nucleotidyltransferase
MLPDDLDLSGWELQKALRLFRKSNPPLLEWLRSPMVYQQDNSFIETMRLAAEQFFNSKNCLYHYYNMARRNWEAYFKGEEVRLKKYLYVLRPILACSWIERTGTMAPMEFSILQKTEIDDTQLDDAINELLLRKMSGEELATGNRIAVLDNFLEERMAYYETLLKTYPANDVPGWDDLNNIFKTTLQQSWKKEELCTL